VLIQIKQNLKSTYNELSGERTDHPFVVRFLAFLADYCLFSATVWIIYFGLHAIKKDSTLSELTISMGLLIVYLTLGNSKTFKGQTIGKKLLRIRTVDNEGNYLEPIKSLVRCLPIVLLLNSYQIMLFIITEHDNLNVLVYYGLTIIFFGTIYFPLLQINRKSLHDMLVSSQVIPRDRMVKIENKSDWPLIAMFVVIVTVYIIYMLN
jgi:uncharacterized RDD family membrane protein YckC